MTHQSDVIVVGSGITGLIAAYASAKKGAKVTLLERAPVLGGILQCFSWDDIHCDYGKHLIWNESNEVTQLIREIVDDQLIEVNLKVSSCYQGKVSEGLELPDLSILPDELKQKFLAEAAPHISQQPHSFKEWLKDRYGASLEPHLSKIFKKIYLYDASEIEAKVHPATPFGQVHLFDETNSKNLKLDPYWDKLIASFSVHSRKPRAFYPAEKGIRFLIDKAKEKLELMGVKIVTGCQLTEVRKDTCFTLSSLEDTYSCSKLVWTAGLSTLAHVLKQNEVSKKLDALIRHVPLILYYYVFPRHAQSDLSYFQNFDSSSPIFRASVPSQYGHNNCPKDKAFVILEVPTMRNQPLWNRPENEFAHFWDQVKKWGIVSGKVNYEKALHKKTPASYKLPLLGYTQACEPILKFAEEQDIIVSDEWAYTKNNLASDILAKINSRIAA